jgi:lysine 2,3-aminomutase
MSGNPAWITEFQSAFRKLPALYDYLGWDLPAELHAVAREYPLFITRRLAAKIKAQGPGGVLAREFMPAAAELSHELNEKGLRDPIGDERFNLAPQLIHRYPSRALFTATSVCPVHCRYCFRKNELSQSHEIFQAEFDQTLAYLREHPEISELIFTGGDPFTLNDERLNFYLQAFATIPSIKDVRFHTRYPVILPERIDSNLMSVLNAASESFRTVSIGIHVNHRDEFDQAAEESIRILGQSKLQLLSQTVLLRGVNDHPEILLALFDRLLQLRVRPYYLHHPDLVKGGMHFYLPITEGREIYASLRQHLPGWAIPHYVVDLPGGSGKISAFNPEGMNFQGRFLNLEGELTDYPGS